MISKEAKKEIYQIFESQQNISEKKGDLIVITQTLSIPHMRKMIDLADKFNVWSSVNSNLKAMNLEIRFFTL